MTEQDKRQQILLGALQVFSEKGYHKASIKDIAKAAAIKSSALIYHYFADKKALLQALIQEQTPFAEIPFISDDVPVELLKVPPELLLPKVVERVLSLLDKPMIVAMLRLFLSEAARLEAVGDAIHEPQKRILKYFAAYLDYHIATGYLRPHDTAASARAFIGMILVYVIGEIVFSGVREGMPEREVYIKEVVGIFLQGVKSN